MENDPEAVFNDAALVVLYELMVRAIAPPPMLVVPFAAGNADDLPPPPAGWTWVRAVRVPDELPRCAYAVPGGSREEETAHHEPIGLEHVDVFFTVHASGRVSFDSKHLSGDLGGSAASAPGPCERALPPDLPDSIEHVLFFARERAKEFVDTMHERVAILSRAWTRPVQVQFHRRHSEETLVGIWKLLAVDYCASKARLRAALGPQPARVHSVFSPDDAEFLARAL